MFSVLPWPAWLGLAGFIGLMVAMTIRRYHSPAYLRATTAGAVFSLTCTLLFASSTLPTWQILCWATVVVFAEIMVDKLFTYLSGARKPTSH